MAGPRIRRPPLPPSLVGLVATLVVAGLLIVWWMVAGGSVRQRSAIVKVPALPERSAEKSLPRVAGPISAFDRAVAENLLRDRPRTTPLRGWLRIALDGVAWDDARGQAFLRAQRITGGLDATAVTRGDVVVAGVDAIRPQLAIYRVAGDTLWNWQHVLAAFLAGPAPGSPPTPPGKERLVEVRGLTPHDGYISIRQPGYDVRFFGTNAVLSRVTLSAPHLAAPVVEVAQARAILERPDRGLRLPFTAAGAHVEFPGDSTTFAIGQLAFGHSRLTGIRGSFDRRAASSGATA